MLAILAGCGSHAATSPVDPTLGRLGHAGDIAYTLGDPNQAADQYRTALGRAREQDDAAAIADFGFNLATAELRAGRSAAALKTIQGLRAELARRGMADQGFDLAAATALFRLGRLAEADQTAARLTAGTGPLADAGWFLRGLIANASNDGAALQQAMSALSPAADAGDKAELQACAALDAGLALHAADLRRDALDYRGMARALALAGQFSPDAAQSAGLYLRAGQSAAAQQDAAHARTWLSKAQAAAAASPALRAEATQALANLHRSGSDGASR